MANWLTKIFDRRRQQLEELQRDREHIEELLSRFNGESIAIDFRLTRLISLTKNLDERIEALDDRAARIERADYVQAVKEALTLVRNGIEEFHASHAEIVRLNGETENNRRALEGLDQRITTLMSQVPDVGRKVENLLYLVAVADEMAQSPSNRAGTFIGKPTS